MFSVNPWGKSGPHNLHCFNPKVWKTVESPQGLSDKFATGIPVIRHSNDSRQFFQTTLTDFPLSVPISMIGHGREQVMSQETSESGIFFLYFPYTFYNLQLVLNVLRAKTCIWKNRFISCEGNSFVNPELRINPYPYFIESRLKLKLIYWEGNQKHLYKKDYGRQQRIMRYEL